jgi:tripartite-type tricarboxylate transporter receptor subunit TctC
MNTRVALRAALIFAALLATTPARSDDYPAHPVRIIVGFPPGSGADITARVVGARMAMILGQQMVIENRPGAGSSLATEFVAHAPKDGYTLLLGNIANAINAVVIGSPRFDFPGDFAPIIKLTTNSTLLAVNPSIGVKSVPELIDLAKRRPDGLSYGSAGVATAMHLSGELFKMITGVRMVHVPYGGSPQAVTDLLAGRIQVVFSPASTVLAHIHAGKLVALASTEAKRSALAPDVPTMAEAGLPGFQTGLWFGLMAPAGTSPEIIEKLAHAANEALQGEEVARAFAPQGIDIVGGSPDDFACYIDADMRRWDKVARAAGLKK